MKRLILTVFALATLAGCGDQGSVTGSRGISGSVATESTIQMAHIGQDPFEKVFKGVNSIHLTSNAAGIVVASLLHDNSILTFDGTTLRPTARSIAAGQDAEINVFVPVVGCISHLEQIRLDFLGDDGQTASAVETVQVVCAE